MREKISLLATLPEFNLITQPPSFRNNQLKPPGGATGTDVKSTTKTLGGNDGKKDAEEEKRPQTTHNTNFAP